MSTKQKKILVGVGARAKLAKGADFLADALQTTMGPHGQNFLIEKGEKLTNDGRNIATEMECEDEIEQKGLYQLRKAAIDTEQEVKDASTTTVVLGRAILKSAISLLPNEKIAIGKMSPSQVLKTIEEERLYVNAKLDEMAVPVTDKKQLVEVATVATEDEKLGQMIGEAQWDLGKDGILIAEDTLAKECSIEIVKGILIDNGLSATHVMTNQEKQSLELKKAHFILTSNTIVNLDLLNPLLSQLERMGADKVVIMARAFSEEAVKLASEYQRQGFPVIPVNAPYVDQRNVMLDLQAVLGGRFVDQEQGGLESILATDVGFCESMVVERYRAVYTGVDDAKSKERIAFRIEELKEKAKGEISVFERENIEKRIAMLETGFGIVRVGASTEIQRKRLKDKADDAVGTVRMALLEGVVSGGGQALKEISDGMEDGSILKMPLRTIYDQIISSAPKGFVIEDWVKDPVKTIKTALKYACEVGGNLATAAGASATKRETPRYVTEVKANENE